MDHLFRTAAFGGFQRQDVLTYLEQTAKEQQEKQQQLQQQLSQAQETGERQSKQLSEQGERLNALAGENQQLRAQLEELRQSLSASQAQAERAGEELARVRGELEAARNRVAALEPDAAAYARWSSGSSGWSGSLTACAVRWSPPFPMPPTSWARPGSVWNRLMS